MAVGRPVGKAVRFAVGVDGTVWWGVARRGAWRDLLLGVWWGWQSGSGHAGTCTVGKAEGFAVGFAVVWTMAGLAVGVGAVGSLGCGVCGGVCCRDRMVGYRLAVGRPVGFAVGLLSASGWGRHAGTEGGSGGHPMPMPTRKEEGPAHRVGCLWELCLFPIQLRAAKRALNQLNHLRKISPQKQQLKQC